MEAGKGYDRNIQTVPKSCCFIFMIVLRAVVWNS